MVPEFQGHYAFPVAVFQATIMMKRNTPNIAIDIEHGAVSAWKI